MRKVFSMSRYLVLIAVVALLLGTLATFIFGFVATINTILGVFRHLEFNAEGARVLSVELIELVDLFLLGTILFLTAVGLYELFVDPGLKEEVPGWMSVSSLEELKFNLLAVVAVMLAVLFLGVAASYEFAEGESVLHYGIATAAVITAAGISIFFFARVRQLREGGERREETAVGSGDAD